MQAVTDKFRLQSAWTKGRCENSDTKNRTQLGISRNSCAVDDIRCRRQIVIRRGTAGGCERRFSRRPVDPRSRRQARRVIWYVPHATRETVSAGHAGRRKLNQECRNHGGVQFRTARMIAQRGNRLRLSRPVLCDQRSERFTPGTEREHKQRADHPFSYSPFNQHLPRLAEVGGNVCDRGHTGVSVLARFPKKRAIPESGTDIHS